MNIILIDDEAVALNALRRRMDWAKYGFEQVFTANSMPQAQQLFSEQRIEVMLCDIEMPWGSGLELFEWVKAHYPAVECVFITCHPEYDYMRKALQLGSADYVLKPIDYGELDGILRALLQRLREKQTAAIPAPVLEQLRQENEENAGEAAVRFVIDYIHKHLGEDIVVADFPELVHLNDRYLSRSFRKTTGLSMLEYITQERLRVARELLRQTEYPVSRVAGSVGYNNLSYFTKIFKRETGMTPQEYRQAGNT